ncbi:MAG: SDR family oxidoreductase [Pseudomonadota bacterium]
MAEPIPIEARSLLCLGYGYSAAALARRLGAREEGWRIIGTTRRPEKAARMGADGVEALLCGDNAHAPSDAAVEAALERCAFLLVSAGPDAAGDPLLRRHGRAVERAAPSMRWAGYLSTTGVYGDHHGAWIDETAALTPATERGRHRVEAESAWRAVEERHGLPLHIFRLAGIYGPGRGPFAKLRGGTARRIVKDGQVFSRIHVDDIAQILEASMRQPRPGAAYNVCDDEPAPPQDVIAHAAALLEMTPPPETPFEEAAATMTPMAASFYSESKRVSNALMKRELGVTLAYPTYREGLSAVLEAEAAAPPR